MVFDGDRFAISSGALGARWWPWRFWASSKTPGSCVGQESDVALDETGRPSRRPAEEGKRVRPSPGLDFGVETPSGWSAVDERNSIRLKVVAGQEVHSRVWDGDDAGHVESPAHRAGPAIFFFFFAKRSGRDLGGGSAPSYCSSGGGRTICGPTHPQVFVRAAMDDHRTFHGAGRSANGQFEQRWTASGMTAPSMGVGGLGAESSPETMRAVKNARG